MAKRAVLGDVFEVSTPIGLAYAQFIGTDDRHGDLIRVLPGTFRSRPSQLSDLVAGPDRYLVFYPVTVLVKQGAVAVVSNERIPKGRQSIPLMLMPGFVDRDHSITSWYLYDGNEEKHLPVVRPEHRRLPIVDSLLHQGLINAIANDWSPSDGFLPGAVWFRKLLGGGESPAVDANRRHLVRAFWYAKSEERARAASAEAEAEGYRATVELDDDDPPRWRVIAEREAVDAPSLEGVDAFFEELAGRLGGAYDGHEVTVAQ